MHFITNTFKIKMTTFLHNKLLKTHVIAFFLFIYFHAFTIAENVKRVQNYKGFIFYSFHAAVHI